MIEMCYLHYTEMEIILMKFYKIKYVLITFILIAALTLPITMEASPIFQKNSLQFIQKNRESTLTNEVEYWALLVAVGIYRNCPAMDRPTMLREVGRFDQTLPVSVNWAEDHMKILQGEDATVHNIREGFKWLDEMEDENDICLVYLTTHGFPHWYDRPPFDEEDGKDEALASYTGFLPFESPFRWEHLSNPFGIILDDQFNKWFNDLESQGLAVIVDSCHSGGFDDYWTESNQRSFSFAHEFASELQGQNRIVVTSVPEEDVSYGSTFSHYLIDGFKGFADENHDGEVTMEEAFYYAEEIVEQSTGMDPQIFDNYPGELTITYAHLPPAISDLSGPQLGIINEEYEYSFTAIDPEENHVSFCIDWGDGTMSNPEILVESGASFNLSHQWTTENAYNIRVKVIDEEGAESDWSNRYVVVMTESDHQVDQMQTNRWDGFLINKSRWCAQSFTPTLSNLVTVGLEVTSWEEGDSFTLSIRENLTKEDIASMTMTPSIVSNWDQSEWMFFSFPSLLLTIGEEYYIVLKGGEEGWKMAWLAGAENPYQNGSFYITDNSESTWYLEDQYHTDGCFITLHQRST